MPTLINSIEKYIGYKYLIHNTAQTSRKKFNMEYLNLENSTQLCELRDYARNLKQA